MFKTQFPKKNRLFPLILLLVILSFQVSYSAPNAGGAEKAIKDIQGRAIAAADYKRIVPLSPNMTEICLALGLKDRIAGASVYSGCPETGNIQKIDGWSINYEIILLLKPDLVLTTSAGNQPQAVDRLRELGLNVFHTEQADLNGIFETIEKIGIITKTSGKAAAITASMKSELSRLEQNLKADKRKPRVLYLLWTTPPMAPGGNTFLTDMITLAGGRNIFESSSARIVKPSLEKIIELDPEVIFLPAGVNLSDLDERWRVISAVRTGKVFHANEDFVLRPGINTVKGIKELADMIQGIRKDGGR